MHKKWRRYLVAWWRKGRQFSNMANFGSISTPVLCLNKGESAGLELPAPQHLLVLKLGSAADRFLKVR